VLRGFRGARVPDFAITKANGVHVPEFAFRGGRVLPLSAVPGLQLLDGASQLFPRRRIPTKRHITSRIVG